MTQKKPDPRATAVKRAAAVTEAAAKRAHANALDPALVKSRLRGPNALVAKNRRLVSVTPTTYKKLEARAKELSAAVGFKVWPLQVAALIVERQAGTL